MITSISASNHLFKQPRGLANLFFVELWERFGFYCVQALLVLYLTKARHFNDSDAYGLFSAFSALIYATPVIGGYLADRLLGFRRAILLGGILYSIGYFALATTDQTIFYPALALLICGNGFFKSCISSLLGSLYQSENDPRRDSGFTIFYIGINTGSFLAPVISSYVATQYGWGYGFLVAGIGMVVGVLVAISGFKKLGAHGLPPDQERLTAHILPGLSRQNLLLLGLIPVILILSTLIQQGHTITYIFNLFGILVVIALLGLTFRYEREQRNKMLALLILIIFAVFFWALYVQMFSSITLLTDRLVDRHLLGLEIPASMYQSLNPFFILSLGPIAAWFWSRLNHSRWSISAAVKFALAMLLIGSSFLLLALSIYWARPNGAVWQGWLVFAYFLQTSGELCLSPIGLSLITALSPPNLTGMMMGVWFLAAAAGYALGGHISELTSIPKEITDPHTMGVIYSQVFNRYGLMAVAIGVVLFVLSPFLRRLTGERT